MKNALKHTFNLCALATGGLGALSGIFGLLTGAFVSTGSGAVDMRTPGAVFTLACAALLYYGYKRTLATGREQQEKNPSEPKKPRL